MLALRLRFGRGNQMLMVAAWEKQKHVRLKMGMDHGYPLDALTNKVALLF